MQPHTSVALTADGGSPGDGSSPQLADAPGEQTEIVGQGAVRVLGNACAQQGDRFDRDGR